MDVRRAKPEDQEALADGNVALAQETENLRLDRATVAAGVAAALQDPIKGRYYVAVDEGGRVVGQLCITWEWSDWRNAWVWWIQSVYVEPESRRQGVYKALYEHVRAEARQDGAAGLRLYVDHTNRGAQQVYAALGMDGNHYRLFEVLFDEDG